MNDSSRISTMRVRRLTYKSDTSPFGLWTYPDPLDGPSFAPCYAPYGEQSPPDDSHPAVKQAVIVPTIEADTRKSETLKPWEKGSKNGKKIKKGRGPKIHSRTDEESSSSSSNNSFNNIGSTGSDGVSTTLTSAPSSSRPSPVSPLVLNPMLAAPRAVLDPRFGLVQEERRPRFRLLPPSAPQHVYPANTAQAVIAESTSTTINSAFLTPTNPGCVERKHARVDNEAPAPSRKMHRME
jgi:hypothetical protein